MDKKLILFVLFIFFTIAMYAISPSKLDTLQHQLQRSKYKSKILLEIAYFYDESGDTLSVEKYIKLALEQSQKENDYYSYMQAKFYETLTLLQNDKLKESRLVLQNALDYIKLSNDRLEIEKSKYYLGRYLFYAGKKKKSVEILKHVISYLHSKNNNSKIYYKTVQFLFSVYSNINRDEDAIKLILKNIDYAISKKNYRTLLDLKMDFASYYMQKELYDKALELYYEILSNKLFKVNSEDKALVYMYIGSMNINRDTKFAKNNAIKAMNIFEKDNDINNLATIYNQLAMIYSNEKNYEKSLEYYNKSIKMSQEINDFYGLSIAYNNIGENYRETHQFDKAVLYYHKAIKLFQEIEIDDDDFLAILYLNLATIKFSQKKYNLALKELDRIKKLKNEDILKNTKIDIYKLYSDIYEKRKQITKAYKYMKKYLNLKNELYSKSKENNLNRLQLQIESLNMENELKILKKDQRINALLMQKTKDKQKYYFLIFFLLLIILLGFIWAYIIKHKTNSELKIANEKIKDMNRNLEELSRIDTLTGLSNRRDIIEKTTYEIVRAERNKMPLAIAICDIDFFKKINDTYGHNCGDNVLKKLSQIFKTFFRKQDIVARWGGEEFLIVMPETDSLSAYIALEKIRHLIETADFKCGDNNLSVTVTFGISEAKADKLLNSIIEEADSALYAGKSNGRNTIIIHSEEN